MQHGSLLSQVPYVNQESFHMPSVIVKQEPQETSPIPVPVQTHQPQRKAQVMISQKIKRQIIIVDQHGSIATDHAVRIEIEAGEMPKNCEYPGKYRLALMESICKDEYARTDAKTPFIQFNVGTCISPNRVDTAEIKFLNNKAKMKLHLDCLSDLPRANKNRLSVVFCILDKDDTICWFSYDIKCWSTPSTCVGNYLPRSKREREDVPVPVNKVAKLQIKNEMHQQDISIESGKKGEDQNQFDFNFGWKEEEVQEPQPLQFGNYVALSEISRFDSSEFDYTESLLLDENDFWHKFLN